MLPEPGQCCAICKAIPFANLPFEDEPAIPHQPSLQALRASAASCTLCGLILQAAILVREAVERDYNGKGLGEGFIDYFFPLLPSGECVAGQEYLGRFSTSGSFYAPEAPENRVPNKLRFEFGDDSSVRPWLFGNWWVRDPPGSPLQLMGLGVRLAATPNIKDGEGNGRIFRPPDGEAMPSVYWHGSFLRVRSEDGKHLYLDPLLVLSRQQGLQ
jgi:hypothetical protein